MKLEKLSDFKSRFVIADNQHILELAQKGDIHLALPIPEGCVVYAISLSGEQGNRQKVMDSTEYSAFDPFFQKLSDIEFLRLDLRKVDNIQDGSVANCGFAKAYCRSLDNENHVVPYNRAAFCEELKKEVADIYLKGGIQPWMNLRYYHAENPEFGIRIDKETYHIWFVVIDKKKLKNDATIEDAIVIPRLHTSELQVEVVNKIFNENMDEAVAQNRQKYLNNPYCSPGLKILVNEWALRASAGKENEKDWISSRIDNVQAELEAVRKRGGGAKCAEYLLRFATPILTKSFPQSTKVIERIKEKSIVDTATNSAFIELCLNYLEELDKWGLCESKDASSLRKKFEHKALLTELIIKDFGFEKTPSENLITVIFDFVRDEDGVKRIRRRSDY